MKEKKRLCFERIYELNEEPFTSKLFIGCVVFCCVLLYIFNGGIEIFSVFDEEEYKPLYDAVDELVVNGKVDLDQCPTGIRYSVYNSGEKNIILKIYYEQYESLVVYEPCVKVELLNGKIQEVSQNYTSRGEFLRGYLYKLILGSLLFGMLLGTALYLIVIIIIEIIEYKLLKHNND